MLVKACIFACARGALYTVFERRVAADKARRVLQALRCAC